MNLQLYLREWDRKIMLELNYWADKGSDWCRELWRRGTLLLPPTENFDCSSSESFFRLDEEMRIFYSMCGGLILPCFDAEDLVVLPPSSFRYLKGDRLFPRYPRSSKSGISGFTEVDARDAVLISTEIDAACIVWIPSNGMFWSLFHEGEDRCYQNFSEAVLYETSRVLDGLLTAPDRP